MEKADVAVIFDGLENHQVASGILYLCVIKSPVYIIYYTK